MTTLAIRSLFRLLPRLELQPRLQPSSPARHDGPRASTAGLSRLRVTAQSALRWTTLVLLAGLLCPASEANAKPQSSTRSLRKLERWSETNRGALDQIAIEDLADALTKCLDHPKVDRVRFDIALLRLTGRTGLEDSTGQGQQVADLCLATAGERLRGVGGADFGAWAFRRVLARTIPSDERMRVGACLVLDEYPKAIGLDPLVQAIADPLPEVRRAALLALTGWAEVDASRALLAAAQSEDPEFSQLARWQLGVHLKALERLAGQAPGPDEGWPVSLSKLLAGALLPDLLSPQWRQALQAAELSRFGKSEKAAPRLIEGLLLWNSRRESHLASKRSDPGDLVGVDRVRWAITDSLRAMSGSAIGPDPRRWRSWWNAVRDGRRQLEAPDGQAGEMRTEAGFFGLRIRSGAVAFLIDSSGSMSARMPASPLQTTTDGLRQQTRFEAATEQLEKFLTSAEEGTVFRLGLFATLGQLYNTSPHRADERGTKAALHWMREHRPDGGTQLSRGFAKLVQADDTGRIKLEKLGFDTLVILCDGATTEGRSWARSWLRNYNSEAQLVIHAVQIGTGRAHALEALTEGSGGQFVRIE